MIVTEKSPVQRCWGESHLLLETYHDREWGVPVHDDRTHFEFMVLDAFQAGLNWLTILKKREAFRDAFAGFDPAQVAAFTSDQEVSLARNASIIRNRQKIRAAVQNARSFLSIQEVFTTFDSYIWQFTGGKSIVNRYARIEDLPARTPESEAMSLDLSRRGFSFVGPTICYAYMQAAGLVNDHLVSCPRHAEIAAMQVNR
ncbi:MAG TPA: DNA-3-methyladenine glycosylase I [Thermoanaerobaculia bacterium]|mgnify:CR=1 FL=1|nr:DNA-3-methyladenine glycosylase I [Thermoanaerobaculia bacterium]HUM30250.1 DNA-3-methyladenine glycosylase I [Thermoanaerobaculia bacterium]HXK68454.1 DNA-3-methyladenine glycosylase I [Thermoanaerobaculia bacterium]